MKTSLALVFTVVMAALPPIAVADCVDAKVRDVLYSIWDNAPNAPDQIAQLRQQYPGYPLSNFLAGAQAWNAGREINSLEARNQALSQLDEAITQLEQNWKTNQTETNAVALATARAHTARMYLFDLHFVKAHKLAKNARDLAARWPDSAEAQLVLGLYEIYTSASDEGLGLVKLILDWSGDREAGISLLESVLDSDSPYADEALRSLLVETAWAYPRACMYRAASEQLVARVPNNPMLSLILQSLQLRCGFPIAALAENTRLSQLQPALEDDQAIALQKARLRAFAQLGKIDEIRVLKESVPNKAGDAAQFALADAFLISQQVEHARTIYVELSKSTTSQLGQLAQVRLLHGYKPPVAQPVEQRFPAPTCK